MKNSRTHDKKKIQAALIIAAFAVIMLFTACKQFLDDPEEFLSYWASEAFVKDHNISSTHRPDKTGVQCVGSSDHAVITLTAHNPKSFSLVMPTSSAPAGIVEFKELSAQPTAGTDYDLKQTGSGSLLLTYKKAFLEKYEQGSGGLNPTITLKATDGRVFQKTYTFGIKSNSPPPKPNEIVIAKTTETTPHYVLCLKFKPNEMTKTVTIGSGPQVPVHKDIRSITIKDNTYTLLYNSGDSNFQKPAETPPIGSFIEHGDVVPLTAPVPSGAWVLYFKTEVAVESNHGQTLYGITLRDAEGVVSDSVTAALKQKFTVTFNSGEGSPVPAQYIENGEKVTRPTNPTRTGFNFAGWYTDNTSYSTQWDFTNNTVTQDITLYAKWTPGSAAYRVEHYQQNIADNYYPSSYTDRDNTSGTTGALLSAGNGITLRNYPGFEFDKLEPDSPTIAADGNTVVKVYYKRKTYNVNFSVNGSNGSITATNVIGGFVTGSSVTVKHGGSITFTAHPDTGYEVDSWSSNVTPQSPNTTATLTVTAPVTVTVSFRQKTYTVTYSVAGGQGTIQADSDTPTTSSNTKQVAHNGSVTFTAYPDTGWEVDSWTLDGSPVNGTNTTYTLSGVTGNKTVTVKFKKKVYTVTFSVADGEGTLQGTYGSQTPTTQNGGGTATLTNVPHGASVSFTATPNDGWELDGWTGVSSSSLNATLSNVTGDKTVTVKFKPGVFNLTGPDAWKKLKEEANKPRGAHTILINGEITATGGDNAGEIKLGRNLTIRGGSSAVLNANGKSHVFDVKNGKTLILEDITIKNGQAQDGKPGGGAAVWGGCTLIMKGSSTITNCKASYGGGVYIDNGGTLIMKDSSTITNCEADDGGGVYVDGTFKMEGGAIVTPSTGSDKNEKGKNDVDLENGKTVTVTGALSHTPAARITPYSYTDGRVLATGAAEKANFKVTPKNGTEYWRYNKVGNEIKFVKAELRITFTKIKCVKVKDGSNEAEYYWTIKVGGDTIDEKKSNQKYMWDAQDHAERSINKFFKRDTNPFPVASIPVNIEIWEYDRTDPDDHIGTTKAHLTYDYDNDQWKWEYDGNWISGPASELHGNQKKNSSKTIGDGGEEIFTEQYRHTEGDTDVTIKISWKE